MNILTKFLRIPSGQKIDIEAHDTWFVRWDSMERTSDGRLGKSMPQVEVFPNEADAMKFAEELCSASKLLKDIKYNNWGPFVEKNRYKGIQP